MNANREMAYYIGIDMGTGSVGMAITDENYNLLKVKGQDYWFVREFETANTQIKRRMHRISKRRLRRHQVRVALIRSYFAEEILKNDPLFFIRQDNSIYYLEDKDSVLKTKDCLFADYNYHDKNYYKDYPTIFHLRQAFIKDTVKDDENHTRYARLLYLAIINMFEHRGHFLLNSVSEDINKEMVKDAGEGFTLYLQERIKEIKPVSYSDILDVLVEKNISRSEKKERIVELFGIKKSCKNGMEIIKCLCGLEANVAIMFNLDDIENKLTIVVSKDDYEDKLAEVQPLVDEESFELLSRIKQLYDYSQLQSILKGYKEKEDGEDKYLSDVRVELYEKHKADLKLLKKVYKRDLDKKGKICEGKNIQRSSKYNFMFRSGKDGTYSAYTNSLNSFCSKTIENKYRRNMKNRDRASLYDTIKKDLSGIENDDVKKILRDIETEQFLPKQITGENGVIPNQIHAKELKAILKNAEKHLPFLTEKDDSGLTVSERIISLFRYCIPYYIGPVGKDSRTGWASIKEEGQIFPWNIEQKIDVDKTSEEFITRLIKTCTYLSNEKVVPKQSLVYERYCVLNEINNIKIRGKRIDPQLKQEIFKELYIGSKCGKKVTRKNLCQYLVNKGAIEEDSEISGIDKDLNTYMSSYGKMYQIFGDKIKRDDIKEVAEEIIYYGTIYGGAKEMFKKKIEQYVSEDILDEAQMNRILGFKFKDWARLSKKFLYLEGYDKGNQNQLTTLMQALWDYNLNTMELMNSPMFTFKETLEKQKNKMEKVLCDFEYEDLDEYYFSAPVKRMVWQTIACLKEVVQIMGHNPKRIFIEMPRADEEKGEQGRKASRKNRLLSLYEEIEDERPWKKEIENAAESGRLNSKRMYLYYLQMGKDAYTGEDIDIEDLFDNSKYDIDHIYPRSLTDDNSLENNLVLVSATINQDVKKNDYPIPYDKIRGNSKVRELWRFLHEKKFMNDEKYNRLMSDVPLTQEQLAGYIARQLVETAQGTKGIADIIKSVIPDADIIYSKAKNVSDFRKRYGMLKSRLTNDFHHAKDAYLNVVVGNVYFTKFTQNPRKYIKDENDIENKKYNYNLSKMYDKDVIRNGKVAWIAQNGKKAGTIQTIKKVMDRNTPIITRQAFEQRGELYDLQPISKHKAKKENYVPIKAANEKMKDVTKYGGFTSLNPAYFVFVEYGSAKKRQRCFAVVHSYWASSIKNNEDLVTHLKDRGYENPIVIADKIKKNSLIKYNGYFLYIVGMDARKQVEFSNATSMCLNNNFIQYIQKIEKANTLIAEAKKRRPYIDESITAERNIALYNELKKKHLDSIFKNHPKGIGSVLESGEGAFVQLSLEQQIGILYSIIQFSSFKKGTFSLTLIGGPKEVGRIRISGNMPKARELKLIHYSITGMYKKEINLLD